MLHALACLLLSPAIRRPRARSLHALASLLLAASALQQPRTPTMHVLVCLLVPPSPPPLCNSPGHGSLVRPPLPPLYSSQGPALFPLQQPKTRILRVSGCFLSRHPPSLPYNSPGHAVCVSWAAFLPRARCLRLTKAQGTSTSCPAAPAVSPYDRQPRTRKVHVLG